MLRQLRSAPNLLTLTRLIFIPFVVVAIQQQNYTWALVIFVAAGITDLLDGLLARVLQQKTTLGQYLDPIADKLLLSTMFLMLSITHIIRWPVTILVFSRDIIILIVCTLLYATGTVKVFRPSWFGKANTAAQIITVPLALLYKILGTTQSRALMLGGIGATLGLTVVSGVHYILRLAFDLRGPHHKDAEPRSS
jgi:cardiolipin synthase (CMP-forming)